MTNNFVQEIDKDVLFDSDFDVTIKSLQMPLLCAWESQVGTVTHVNFYK